MKNKLISFILVFTFIAFPITSEGAENYDNKPILEYASEFLSTMGFKEDTVKNQTLLYNFKEKIEAICYNIGNNGYIIINVNDLSIPEFSNKINNPYIVKNKTMYYNGPLNYFIKDDNKFVNLNTHEKILKDNIKNIYSKKINDNKIDYQNFNLKARANEEHYLEGDLREWTSNHACGVDATAILLMYYDDYYNDSFVSTSYESSSKLTDFLADTYISDAGTDGEELECGIDQYLSDKRLNSYDANEKNYSFTKIVSLIKQDKPVIAGTEPGNPIDDNHWIIVHEVSEYEDGYLIVNDGWGNNGIGVTADSEYYDNIVWIDD